MLIKLRFQIKYDQKRYTDIVIICSNMDETKYKNGKIYMIWNTQTHDIYIGSTVGSLHKRMYNHRNDALRGKSSHRKLYSLMNALGIEQFRIELLEYCSCSSREELRRREGEKIRELKASLNMNIAGRTNAEYRLDNIDYYRCYNQQYRADHKQELSTYSKAYRETNKEHLTVLHKQIYEQNKDMYLQRMKEYRWINTEKIKELQKKHYAAHRNDILSARSERIVCDVCGGSFPKYNQSHHNKSAKHQKALHV